MAKWQGYGIGLEKQYYMLRNAEDAALCVNITKYAEELVQLIAGGVASLTHPTEVPTPKQENYKERSKDGKSKENGHCNGIRNPAGTAGKLGHNIGKTD